MTSPATGTERVESLASVVGGAPPVLDRRPNLPPLVEMSTNKPLIGNVFYAEKAIVLGDIHGSTKVDLRKHPDRLKVLLGDVADRGVGSWKQVKEVIQLVEEGKALCCIGNHEALFMGAMTKDESGSNKDTRCLLNWLFNGGYITAFEAGVNMGPVGDLIQDYRNKNSAVFQQKQSFFLREYLRQGFSQQEAQRYAEIQAQQECFQTMVQEMIQQRRVNELNRALNDVLLRVRNSDNLKKWYETLVNHGLMYAVVNDSLNTHAAILPDKKYGGYGVGLKGVDNLQDKIRQGDAEAIYFLALDDDSPLWTREEYLDAIANPQKASEIRRKLNEQASTAHNQRPAFKIEMVNTGHTPINRPEVKRSTDKITSLQRSGDPKFVLLDYEYHQSGVLAAMQIDLNPTNGEVSAQMVDYSTGGELNDKEGKPVQANWKIDVVVSQIKEQADRGINDSDAAREALQKIANFQQEALFLLFTDFATPMVRGKVIEVLRELVEGNGEKEIKALQEKFSSFLKEIGAQERDKRFSELIAKLKNSSDLASSALGYDLEIAMKRERVRQINEYLRENPNASDRQQQEEERKRLASEIEALKKERNGQIEIPQNASEEERKKIEEQNRKGQERSQKFPQDQVEAKLKPLVEQIGKAAGLSDEERKKLEGKDCLSVMAEIFGGVIDRCIKVGEKGISIQPEALKNFSQGLIDSGLINENGANEINKLATQLEKLDEEVKKLLKELMLKEVGKKALIILLGILGVLSVLGYISAQKEMGGDGGRHMM